MFYPSQLRYLSYYEQYLNTKWGNKPANYQRRLVLDKIVMHTIPMFGIFGGCSMCCLSTRCFLFMKFLFSSMVCYQASQQDSILLEIIGMRGVRPLFCWPNFFPYKFQDGKKGRQVVEFDCCCTIVNGDIKIEFFDGGFLSVCRREEIVKCKE